MKGQFVLVSGSASRTCSTLLLSRAIDFIQVLVPEVLKAGGGFVVLLGNEEATKGSDGNARIFDWTILRAIEPYAEETLQPQRVYARVLVRDDAWKSRMSESNQGTFNRLQQRGALEVHRVRKEVYTGGKYREVECEFADCMLALGGGKGTYSAGQEMIALGKPVLPLDLEIGSLSEDGEGALLLHKEFQAKPEEFFPATYLSIANRIESLSLQVESQDPVGVARRATEVLDQELDAGLFQDSRPDSRFGALVDGTANRLLKVTGVLRAFEYLKNWIPML